MRATFVPAVAGDLLQLADGAFIALTGRFSGDEMPDPSDSDAREMADFEALQQAAAASAQLIVESADVARRIVLSIETDAKMLSIADIVAIYVDEQGAQSAVTTVTDAVRAGTDPSEQQFDAMEECFLLWHGPSELASIIDELGVAL